MERHIFKDFTEHLRPLYVNTLSGFTIRRKNEPSPVRVAVLVKHIV